MRFSMRQDKDDLVSMEDRQANALASHLESSEIVADINSP